MFNKRGALVPKFGGAGGQQILKVLRINLWVGVPWFKGSLMGGSLM